MKHIDFYNKLNSMEDKEYIEKFLLYTISPVIAGLKPASTITLKKNSEKLYDKWIRFGRDFIEKINLNFIELRENHEAVVIMIYDKNLLEECIFEEDSNKFLSELGYSQGEIEEYLINLKIRYGLYHCPHELGLFLGIPIKDVKDFMECSEKKCLLCGYWKVYNDFDNAQKIFNSINKIKDHTMDNIIKGNKSKDLTQSIKSFFYYPKEATS